MPDSKTRAVLAIRPRTFHPETCRRALLAALGDHCVNLTGNEERDVSRFEAELGDDGIYVLGYHGGLRRAFVHLELAAAPATVGIQLRATKGGLDILDADWGDVGPLIGNSILVARLLHVGICVLRAQGVGALVNEPYTPRLEARYTSMGFEDGRRMSLCDARALERAFGFVKTIYDGFGIDLRAPPPRDPA